MAGEVGFIGLGMMGDPMARRLIAQDHKLIVHDVRPDVVAEFSDLGAEAAASPAEVASRVETVLVSLPTPDVVAEVALGTGGIAEGSAVKTFVDLSTTGPGRAAEIATALKAKGITAIDAPVSGGVAGARSGGLAVMLAGPRELCDSLVPMLRAIGKNVLYVGPEPGQGQMMKIINNLLSATALAATSEAFVLGAKYGLDPKVMVDVLNVSSGRNSATEEKIPRAVLTRTFDVGFRTELQLKDVKLCLEQAEKLGVPMWIGQTVKEMWAFANSQTGGETDISAIIKIMEQWAGVTVKGSD